MAQTLVILSEPIRILNELEELTRLATPLGFAHSYQRNVTSMLELRRAHPFFPMTCYEQTHAGERRDPMRELPVPSVQRIHPVLQKLSSCPDKSGPTVENRYPLGR